MEGIPNFPPMWFLTDNGPTWKKKVRNKLWTPYVSVSQHSTHKPCTEGLGFNKNSRAPHVCPKLPINKRTDGINFACDISPSSYTEHQPTIKVFSLVAFIMLFVRRDSLCNHANKPFLSLDLRIVQWGTVCRPRVGL